MRVFSLPPRGRALIFDMDNTLYTHREYAEHQEAVLVRRLAEEMGWGLDEAGHRVDEFRRGYAAGHRGNKPSLGNTFLALGVDMATSVRWRNEEIRPEDFLTADPDLRHTLFQLAEGYSLGVVTNNPVDLARRTLNVLGIGEGFRVLVGLDTTLKSKPSLEPFRSACEALELPPGECISVGDRFGVDIEPALELGMGGILVDSVGDLYTLPQILHPVSAGGGHQRGDQ